MESDSDNSGAANDDSSSSEHFDEEDSSAFSDEEAPDLLADYDRMVENLRNNKSHPRDCLIPFWTISMSSVKLL